MLKILAMLQVMTLLVKVEDMTQIILIKPIRLISRKCGKEAKIIL